MGPCLVPGTPHTYLSTYTSNKFDATLAQAVEWVSKRDILLVKGEKSTFPRLFFSNSRFETLLKVPQSTMVTELGKYNEWHTYTIYICTFIVWNDASKIILSWKKYESLPFWTNILPRPASNSKGTFSFNWNTAQNYFGILFFLLLRLYCCHAKRRRMDGPQFWCKNEAKGQRVNSTFSSLEDLDKFMTRISWL